MKPHTAEMMIIIGIGMVMTALLYLSDKLLILVSGIGATIAVIGGVVFGNVLVNDANEREIQRAMNTEAVRVNELNLNYVQALRALPPKAIEMLPADRVIPGSHGVIALYKANETEIPYSIIKEYLANSTATWCCPIRRFADGTPRQAAQQFEDELIQEGLVERERLNPRTPLRWRGDGYRLACKMWLR